MNQHQFSHRFLPALLFDHPDVRRRLDALPLNPEPSAPHKLSRRSLLQRWASTLADVRIDYAMTAQRGLTDAQKADLEALAVHVGAMALIEAARPRRRRGEPVDFEGGRV